MITIDCICGIKYSCKRTVFPKCPKCNHIWKIADRSKTEIKPLTEFNFEVETGIQMKNIFDIAKEHGRDYITPEDITESIKSEYPHFSLMKDVLATIGKQNEFGCEDTSLCAFVALKYEI